MRIPGLYKKVPGIFSEQTPKLFGVTAGFASRDIQTTGGRLIIPTYMNRTDKGTTNRVSGAIGKAGADFKREFTPDTYRQFFAEAGYPDAEYALCEGRIPCAVAVLQKREESV